MYEYSVLRALRMHHIRMRHTSTLHTVYSTVLSIVLLYLCDRSRDTKRYSHSQVLFSRMCEANCLFATRQLKRERRRRRRRRVWLNGHVCTVHSMTQLCSNNSNCRMTYGKQTCNRETYLSRCSFWFVAPSTMTPSLARKLQQLT